MMRTTVAAIAAITMAACAKQSNEPGDTYVDTLDAPEDRGDTIVPDTAEDTATDTTEEDATTDTPAEPECLADEDCDNDLYCDGEEQCLEGSCSPGVAVVCDDSIFCTRDACNDTTDGCDFTHDDTICDDTEACTTDVCDTTADSCVNTLIDGDSDTHPPESCGGDDCDDTLASVHPGATEICGDGVDQDCDGSDGDVGTCSCPISMTGGTSFPGDTTGATAAHDGSCATGTGPEDVYAFTVATAGLHHFDTDVSSFDTILYIRESPCDTGTELDCDDDGGDGTSGVTSALNLWLDPGTYYVFVDGYDTLEYGTYTLEVETFTATALAGGDTCSAAVALPADGGYWGYNTTMTDTSDGSCLTGTGADVWFTFTLSAASTVSLATRGSGFDTVLYVLGGSCTGTELGCDDDGGMGLDSFLSLGLAAGTYYVAVDAYDSTETGMYLLTVTGIL